MGVAYQNAQGTTGTLTITAPASPGTTWNLTALSVSQAGPTIGPNARVTVYDGAAGSTILHREFLPGAGTSSVGNTTEIKIPRGPTGVFGIQGTPGNAMTIVVEGTGANQVSANARFNDGLSS